MAMNESARHAGDGKELNAVQARQGFRDRPVLVVLTISTLLICVAFAVVYFYYLP